MLCYVRRNYSSFCKNLLDKCVLKVDLRQMFLLSVDISNPVEVPSLLLLLLLLLLLFSD